MSSRHVSSESSNSKLVSAALEDVEVLLGTGVVARVEVVVDVVTDKDDRLEENDGAIFSLLMLDVDMIDETDAVHIRQ